MISYARKDQDTETTTAEPVADNEHIAPAPRISVQAFCETVETAAAVQSAGEDRRLGKAHLKIQMGGMAAAVEAYSNAPTPNVIVLETDGRSDILAGLDDLSGVCDAGTRVIVIGRMNDVTLYRELVDSGLVILEPQELDANDLNRGFDAQTGEYVDMVKAGIIDPTKVVRLALQNAASVAGLLVTTEAMVAEKPEKKTMPAMPHGGGMDGMDDF